MIKHRSPQSGRCAIESAPVGGGPTFNCYPCDPSLAHCAEGIEFGKEQAPGATPPSTALPVFGSKILSISFQFLRSTEPVVHAKW